jgi:hypothetical protein
MKPGSTEAINALISASETDDAIGTIVRMHLLIEEIITRYLEVRVTGELKEFIKQPREFAPKLHLAAAFGMPIPLVRAAHRLNVIRNKLAHRLSDLDQGDLKQLEIAVNRLSEIDSSFLPLEKRYLELPAKSPGVRRAYGSDEHVNLIIASVAFYITASQWLTASFPSA